MSLRRFFLGNRKAEANRSSLERPTYTSNVTTAPTRNLPGRDSVRQPDGTESSLTDTLGVAESSEVATLGPNYIYYRIYAEDGAIPSMTPVASAPGDPFLGRIKARSVPPPRTARDVQRSIAKVENIKDSVGTSLFFTPYSQSPLDNAYKLTIFNGTGWGSTPQKPLALVAKMSDSERSALESDGRGELASAADSDTTSPGIRYVYYLLYADGYEMPSKVTFDPDEPSLGRIRADSVTPPHSPTSILRCISRVERNPAIVNADLFADTSCDTPLEDGDISILRTDGPGLSPNEPMAIVQVTKLKKKPSIPDGKYVIKNRAADIYWSAGNNPIKTVYFYLTTMEDAKKHSWFQWDITRDTNGNITMTSPYAPSSWVGADIKGSTVPVPWRLIPADPNSYYLTTDMNRASRNPQVPTAQEVKLVVGGGYGTMATLKEGDQWQMWEFIRI